MIKIKENYMLIIKIIILQIFITLTLHLLSFYKDCIFVHATLCYLVLFHNIRIIINYH